MTKYLTFIALFSFSIVSCQNHGESFKYKFGILRLISDQSFSLEEETNIIPLIPDNGKDFHGLIIFPPDNRDYTVHRVYHFPASPKNLVNTAGEELSGSRDVFRTQKEIFRGIKALPAAFHPDDPLGDYRLDLFINGKLIGSVRYKVVKNQ